MANFQSTAAPPTSSEVQRFPLTSTLSPINADDEEWLRQAASFFEDSEGAVYGGLPMDPSKVPQSFYPKSALTETTPGEAEDPLPLSLLPLLPLEPGPRQEQQMLKQQELAVYQDLLQKLSHAVHREELQGFRRSETQSFYGRRPLTSTVPWQSFYGASQSRFASESSRCHACQAPPKIPAPLHVQRIPTVNPWKERGRLVEALSLCGLVFLRTDGLPEPSFDRWEQLWREALWQTPIFRRRPLVTSSHLRFSQGEDLLRTRSGEQKEHTPDVRYNFGLGLEALRQASKRWGDLQWMRMELLGSFNALSAMLTSELFALAPLQQEPPGSLGALVAKGTEYYKGSRMRHCIYPSNGSCTEHTDYGLVTFQKLGKLESKVLPMDWKRFFKANGFPLNRLIRRPASCLLETC
eukprot:symbB.v1.2.021728.t1/scaffold1895.1/size96826/3